MSPFINFAAADVSRLTYHAGEIRADSRRLLRHAYLAPSILLALAFTARAQNTPHLGYVYPAGGRQGTTFQVLVGGQFLVNVTNAFVSGAGVHAKVMEYNRPLNQKEFSDLRDR